MRGLFRIFLVVYCVLLGASHCVRREIATGVPPSGAQTVRISEGVEIAYREVGDEPLPSLVLLHGSPVAAVTLTPLMNALEGKARLVVPDLPGFGGSTLDVEDYSTRAHAVSVFELMDHLQIDHAHVLVFSMGGGVALEMVEMKPQRVSSVVMVSSIGVQELELLGDYTLNYAVHGLQLAALSGLQAGVPHFGWMDRFPLNRSYARNFYDTDQRPYRSYLGKLEAPTLIVHGENDFLVPYAAAEEHHRLVPQSELVTINDVDHITVIRQPEKVAPAVIDFVNRVEVGQGTPRSQAESARVTLASEPFEQHRPKRDSWGGVIFLMVLLALATLVSEDLTCIGAGLLVARGAMEFLTATIACLLGIFIDQLGARLSEVPKAGEWVALTDVGTHCRGALFLDGGEHITEQLRTCIDRVSRGFEGFYFGRYDLRVRSEEDLRLGRNLKVIELNGVTSESTDIYDPKHGLWHAYRTLFEQWQIAFEIGARNRDKGIQPSGAMALWKLMRP